MNNLLSKLWSGSKASLAELKRTGWALFFVLLGLLFISKGGREIFVQQIGVLAWKLVLIGTGIFTAHKARTQLFPYVDLSAHVANGDAIGGQIFLGVCILAGAIILALGAGL